jgi:transposase
MPKMTAFPGPNSVLVLDNASIHLKDQLRHLIEFGMGGVVEFLPPYSPDYNPIEKCWAAYKTWLRGNPDIVSTINPFQCIDLALGSIDPHACRGWISFVPFYM